MVFVLSTASYISLKTPKIIGNNYLPSQFHELKKKITEDGFHGDDLQIRVFVDFHFSDESYP